MAEEINYKIIREIQRAEKDSVALTKLENGFSKMVKAYLYELESRIKKTKHETSMFRDELLEQLQSEYANAKKIITDIYERREKKIIMNALTSIRTNSETKHAVNYLLEERELYKELKKNLEKNRDKHLKNLLTPVKGEEKEQKVLKTIKVRILEEIPSFVWDDEKTYGPYEKNQDAEVPESIAEFLIDNNKATENETTEKREEILPPMQDARGAQDSASQKQKEEIIRQD